MDSTTDHAARISARIEEYRTLDLIGRNSADDLQHHLRALVAELDEANARASRLQVLWQTFEHAEGHPATDERWQAHKRAYRDCIEHGDFLPRIDTDLDAAPGDTAEEGG